MILYLKLKTYNKEIYNQFKEFINTKIIKYIHLHKFKNFLIKKKYNRFSLLRSPHVNKKSQIQFEYSFYIYICRFNLFYINKNLLLNLIYILNFKTIGFLCKYYILK